MLTEQFSRSATWVIFSKAPIGSEDFGASIGDEDSDFRSKQEVSGMAETPFSCRYARISALPGRGELSHTDKAPALIGAGCGFTSLSAQALFRELLRLSRQQKRRPHFTMNCWAAP